MSDPMDDHINAFIGAFRAASAPPEGPCIICGDEAETYCEGCHARLCEDHADSETYSDVDMCRDVEACERRIANTERKTTQ